MFNLFKTEYISSAYILAYIEKMKAEFSCFDFKDDEQSTHIRNEIKYKAALNDFMNKGYNIRDFFKGKKFKERLTIEDAWLTKDGGYDFLGLRVCNLQNQFTTYFQSRKLYKKLKPETINKNDTIEVIGTVSVSQVLFDVSRADRFGHVKTDERCIFHDYDVFTRSKILSLTCNSISVFLYD